MKSSETGRHGVINYERQKWSEEAFPLLGNPKGLFPLFWRINVLGDWPFAQTFQLSQPQPMCPQEEVLSWNLVHYMFTTPQRGAQQEKEGSVPVVSQVEVFHRILAVIGSIIRHEPSVLHISARPDRQAQMSEVKDSVHTHRGERNVVITSDLGKLFLIIWPYENLEVVVDGSGVMINLLHSPSGPTSPRGRVLLEYCRSARYLTP